MIKKMLSLINNEDKKDTTNKTKFKMTISSREELLDTVERFSVNIREKNGEIDVVLGHDKHILGNYKRNNVKLIGGWYEKDIELNTELLAAIIEKYKIKKINFIGASKSCTGAIILAKSIIKAKVKTPKMRLFLFSGYTTLDKNVYQRRKIIEKAPSSLVKLWDSEFYTDDLIKKAELRRLVNNKFTTVYLFYPTRSKYGEKVLASRIKGDNIYHIGLPVYMHNTLYPMWKKVDKNGTIEIYEGIIKNMHKDDYRFYSEMQEYQDYNFHLYSILENPSLFQENLKNFIKNYKEKYAISY